MVALNEKYRFRFPLVLAVLEGRSDFRKEGKITKGPVQRKPTRLAITLKVMALHSYAQASYFQRSLLSTPPSPFAFSFYFLSFAPIDSSCCCCILFSSSLVRLALQSKIVFTSSCKSLSCFLIHSPSPCGPRTFHQSSRFRFVISCYRTNIHYPVHLACIIRRSNIPGILPLSCKLLRRHSSCPINMQHANLLGLLVN